MYELRCYSLFLIILCTSGISLESASSLRIGAIGGLVSSGLIAGAIASGIRAEKIRKEQRRKKGQVLSRKERMERRRVLNHAQRVRDVLIACSVLVPLGIGMALLRRRKREVDQVAAEKTFQHPQEYVYTPPPDYKKYPTYLPGAGYSVSGQATSGQFSDNQPLEGWSDAVSHADVSLIKSLLARGVAFEATRVDGRTVLHVVAGYSKQFWRPEIFDALVDAGSKSPTFGAFLTIKDAQGYDALGSALVDGTTDAVERLLEVYINADEYEALQRWAELWFAPFPCFSADAKENMRFRLERERDMRGPRVKTNLLSPYYVGNDLEDRIMTLTEDPFFVPHQPSPKEEKAAHALACFQAPDASVALYSGVLPFQFKNDDGALQKVTIAFNDGQPLVTSADASLETTQLLRFLEGYNVQSSHYSQLRSFVSSKGVTYFVARSTDGQILCFVQTASSD